MGGASRLWQLQVHKGTLRGSYRLRLATISLHENPRVARFISFLLLYILILQPLIKVKAFIYCSFIK